MMLGRTMVTPVLAGVLLDDALAQRLGEGVAVGPAEAAGPLGAEPDQLVLDPLPAGLLGRAGGGQQPGAAVRLARPSSARSPSTPRCGTGARPTGAGRDPRRARPRGRRRAAPAPPGCCRGDARRRTPWRCARSARRRPPRGPGRAASRVPTTLVRKPSSTGGSKDTSPAQCTTASRSVGQRRARRRGRPRATRTRRAISASTPPAAVDDGGEDRLAQQRRDPGLRRWSSPCGRTSRVTWTPGNLGQHQVQQRLADEAGHAGEQDALPVEPRRDAAPSPMRCTPPDRASTQPIQHRGSQEGIGGVHSRRTIRLCVACAAAVVRRAQVRW